ncbi:MAG: DUF2703 domain-containing protein [Nitrospiraceae bacterium]|nr:MAG: DUF2703 domain-containing protein [Nitrospiraceae bacterium]
MRALKIKWQRLLIDEIGQTCPRCGSTENEIDKAVNTLNRSLAPLGIDVIIEKKVLDSVTFAKNVLESNRIWINDVPLEKWLGAEVDQSLCCDVCGDAECRTVKVGENIYETIPADLIVKTGLIAASNMIAIESKEPCCENNVSKEMSTGTGICCQIPNNNSSERK